MYYSSGRYFVIAFVFPAEVPKRLPDNEDARELSKALCGANLLTLQKDSVRQCCSKYKAHSAYHQETVYV